MCVDVGDLVKGITDTQRLFEFIVVAYDYGFEANILRMLVSAGLPRFNGCTRRHYSKAMLLAMESRWALFLVYRPWCIQ